MEPKYKFQELIDVQSLHSIMSTFYSLTGISSSILDMEGNIIIGDFSTGWKHICMDFHRTHPETRKKCMESDTMLCNKLLKGENYTLYHCLNGMIDSAVPIVIEGEHVANLFSGQYFLSPPDVEFFRNQALNYGFYETAYMAALDEVSILPEEKVKEGAKFLKSLAEVICQMGLSNLRMKRMNEQLEAQAQERKYLIESVFSSMQDGMSVMDRNGMIIDVNDAFCRITGFSREELTGTGHPFWPQESQDDIERALNKTLNGDFKEHELIFKRKNGERFPAIVTPAPVFDSSGHIVSYCSIIKDITERKMAEERANQFAAIVQSSEDAIIGKTLDGIITSWNRGAEKIYGYPESEVIGKPVTILVPQGIEEDVTRILEKIKSGEYVQHYEAVRRRKDGRNIQVWLTVSPVRNAEGRIVAASTIARDITEHNLAEEALTQEKNFTNKLLNAQPDTVFLFDSATGKPIRWNKRFTEVSGYNDEEIAGMKAPDDFYERFDLERAKQDIDKIFAEGQGKVELPLLTKQGMHIPFEYVATYVETGDEKALLLSIGRDITERKRVEEELKKHRDHLEELVRERTAELVIAKDRAEESDRLKSVFLTTISHELRTPLNSIIGFTSLILDGFSGPLTDEQKIQLNMVKNSGKQLLSVISDVLDVSKIISGKLDFTDEPFKMREAVETTVKTLRPFAEEKGLALHLEVAPEVGMIVSDRRRIEQVLYKLLHNAIKFTEKGEVRVDCLVEGDRIITRLTDTGIGIKPENIDKLFKPFLQIDDGLDRRYEGTGLGLLISKKLAGMLGGDITAESVWGKGSVFTFTLPLGRQHETKNTHNRG